MENFYNSIVYKSYIEQKKIKDTITNPSSTTYANHSTHANQTNHTYTSNNTNNSNNTNLIYNYSQDPKPEGKKSYIKSELNNLITETFKTITRDKSTKVNINKNKSDSKYNKDILTGQNKSVYNNFISNSLNTQRCKVNTQRNNSISNNNINLNSQKSKDKNKRFKINYYLNCNSRNTNNNIHGLNNINSLANKNNSSNTVNVNSNSSQSQIEKNKIKNLNSNQNLNYLSIDYFNFNSNNVNNTNNVNVSKNNYSSNKTLITKSAKKKDKKFELDDIKVQYYIKTENDNANSGTPINSTNSNTDFTAGNQQKKYISLNKNNFYIQNISNDKINMKVSSKDKLKNYSLISNTKKNISKFEKNINKSIKKNSDVNLQSRKEEKEKEKNFIYSYNSKSGSGNKEICKEGRIDSIKESGFKDKDRDKSKEKEGNNCKNLLNVVNVSREDKKDKDYINNNVIYVSYKELLGYIKKINPQNLDVENNINYTSGAINNVDYYTFKYDPINISTSSCYIDIQDKTNNTEIKNIMDKYKNIKSFSIFAIFDGYNGPSCPLYLKQNLLKYIYSNNSYFPHNPLMAIKYAFSKIDNEFNEIQLSKYSDNFDSISSLDVEDSAASALICLILDNTLYIGNIGNCKALLCLNKGQNQIMTLSEDHTLNNQTEKERIILNGGKIYQEKILLNNYILYNNIPNNDIVYDKENNKNKNISKVNEYYLLGPSRFTPGNLSVTRSIGNTYLKFKSKKTLLSSEPYINSYQIDKNYDFIFLCNSSIENQLPNNKDLFDTISEGLNMKEKNPIKYLNSKLNLDPHNTVFNFSEPMATLLLKFNLKKPSNTDREKYTKFISNSKRSNIENNSEDNNKLGYLNLNSAAVNLSRKEHEYVLTDPLLDNIKIRNDSSNSNRHCNLLTKNGGSKYTSTSNANNSGNKLFGKNNIIDFLMNKGKGSNYNFNINYNKSQSKKTATNYKKVIKNNV